jgi:hypothetical protein
MSSMPLLCHLHRACACAVGEVVLVAAKLEKVAWDSTSNLRDGTHRDEHREVLRCSKRYISQKEMARERASESVLASRPL